MRFTAYQYEAAIQALRDASKQLEPDGHPCSVCGGDDHMAFECGMNPLLAMAMCEELATSSRELHELLHQLGGFNTHMGVRLGPARVSLPPEAEEPELMPEPPTAELTVREVPLRDAAAQTPPVTVTRRARDLTLVCDHCRGESRRLLPLSLSRRTFAYVCMRCQPEINRKLSQLVRLSRELGREITPLNNLKHLHTTLDDCMFAARILEDGQ